jgi:hypothetical protein
MNELLKLLLDPIKELVAKAVRKFFEDGEATQFLVALGTVTSDYTSGRPKVKFDRDASASNKTYGYVSSYSPAANDRVVLLRSGGTWVIIGKLV